MGEWLGKSTSLQKELQHHSCLFETKWRSFVVMHKQSTTVDKNQIQAYHHNHFGIWACFVAREAGRPAVIVHNTML